MNSNKSDSQSDLSIPEAQGVEEAPISMEEVAKFINEAMQNFPTPEGARLAEEQRRMIAEYEIAESQRQAAFWVENGVQYCQCAGCGKILRNRRFLGTFHLCK